MLEGLKVNNIPDKLKNILNVSCFLNIEDKPGIYVCFFPHNNTVYIGMSKSIKREIGFLKSSKEKRPRIIKAFAESGSETKCYALLQGKGLENEKLRRELEKKFIALAGPNSLNIAGKRGVIYPKIVYNTSIITPDFQPLQGSWSQYDLEIPYLPPKETDSCIYVFLNKKTKRFYVGQTAESRLGQRIKEHRQNIARKAIIQVEQETFYNPNLYDGIAKDVLNDSPNFVYSPIQYTDQLSESERLAIERQTILNFYIKYNSRLYNKPSSKDLKVLQGTHRIDRGGQLRPIRFPSLKSLQYPCIIEGKWSAGTGGKNRTEAKKALGITDYRTLDRRCAAKEYPNYISLKNTCNKKIPETLEIKEKLKDFHVLLERIK